TKEVKRASRIYARARTAASQFHDWEDRELAERFIRASMAQSRPTEAGSTKNDTGAYSGQGERPSPTNMTSENHQDPVEALRSANAITDPFQRATFLMQLSRTQGISGWSDVAPAIFAIERTDSRGYAWSLYATSLKAAGLPADSAEAYRQAIAAYNGLD